MVNEVTWGPASDIHRISNEFLDHPKTRKSYADLSDAEWEVRNQRTAFRNDGTGKLNVYSDETLAKRLELQKAGKWKSDMAGFRKQAQAKLDADDDWQKFLEEEKREKLQKKLHGVRPSDIILYALSAIEIMQQLAGAALPVGLSAWEGSPTYPYQGDCFKAGSQYFAELAALLAQAVPPSWQGAAADAYTTELATLVTQTQKMAALDLKMETLVKDHAGVVVDTQLGIGIEQGVLLVAYPIIRVLEVKPETYPAALSAATATAGGAIYAAMGLLSWCLGTSIQTQQAVDGLAYGDVIAAVQRVIDAFSSAAVPAPAMSAHAA